ncbi:MAG: hypothetical protein FJ306_13445 [Planctomycetes bacterium]|nr:hypothetical protein [Planctomycetota bacterium]
MRPGDHDPLLQASLTEHDDAVGFRSPWDPSTLGWLALLVGPFGAGLLMWRNQPRLGLRGGAHLALVMTVVGAAVLAAGIFFVPDVPKASAAKPATAAAMTAPQAPAGEPATAPTATNTTPTDEIPLDAIGLSAPAAKPKNAAEERRDTRRVIRFVGNAVALPLAWWLLAAQRRRFRIAEQSKAPTGKLLLPGLQAFGVNFAISFVLAAAFTALKHA